MSEHCSNQVSPLSPSPLNNSVVFGYLVCHECLLLVSPRRYVSLYTPSFVVALMAPLIPDEACCDFLNTLFGSSSFLDFRSVLF